MKDGKEYKLYKYDDENRIPTSKFNANAKNAVSVKTIVSDGFESTHTFETTIVSSQKVFYRCVLATAPWSDLIELVDKF